LDQNVSVLKDQKIYIAGEPARSNTRMIRKGTGSLRDQNSKPLKNNNSEKTNNGYERNQK
jgi:hypothetical protein